VSFPHAFMKHRLRVVLICLIALLLMVYDRIKNDPAQALIAQDPPIPTAQPRLDRSFRLVAHTLLLDESMAQLAQQAGFDSVIQVFAWRDTNLQPGVYVWDFADDMVSYAQAQHLDLIMRLDMPPYWAIRADPAGLPPTDPHGEHAGLNLARLIDLHDILLEANASQPIWITELGYTVRPGLHPNVPPADQANYLLGAFERVRAEWSWVEMFTVWNLSYMGGDDEMQGFSIINLDRSPRRAFHVIQDMRRQLETHR
jgi:hypothetical protein